METLQYKSNSLYDSKHYTITDKIIMCVIAQKARFWFSYRNKVLINLQYLCKTTSKYHMVPELLGNCHN